MLDTLRQKAKGWIAQLLIALLVVAFAFWGVSNVFSGIGGDVVATVGQGEVKTITFARQYELARQRAAQQLGRPITGDEAAALGIPARVLGQLVADAALDDRTTAFGMDVSGGALVSQLAKNAIFQAPDGSFDRNRFEQQARALGMSENEFFGELTEDYTRQQLVSALFGGLVVPDALIRPFDELQKEERTVTYINLLPSLAGEIAEPSEAELSTFFEANKSTWRTPELRNVKVLVLSAADIANPDDITDDQAREVYDTQLDTTYTTPERRRVQQIVFPDGSAAADASTKLAGGMSFEDLLAELGQTEEGVTLGLVSRDGIADPAVAEAAFGLDLNAVSEVVEGRFGSVIVRVTEIEPAVVTSYEEAEAGIKQALAEDRARQEISGLLDVIEDARAGGASLDDVAADYELEITTVEGVDRNGRDVDGNAVSGLPGGREMISEIYQSDVGLENNPIQVDDGYAWFEVTEVSQPRDRELSEVREQAIAAFKQDKIDTFLADKADEIRQQVSSGKAIDEVATEDELTVETADGVVRQGNPTAGLSAAAIAAAFGGPEGHVAIADGPDGAKTVLVVSNVTIPPYFSGSPEGDQIEQALNNQISEEFSQLYIRHLIDSLGVTQNNTAIQAVISGTPQG